MKWRVKATVIFLMIVAVFVHLEAGRAPEAAGVGAEAEVSAAAGDAEAPSSGTDVPEEPSARADAQAEPPLAAPFVQVVAVPDGSPAQWREPLQRALRERFGDGPVPTVVGVAAEDGDALYEPIPSPGGRALSFVALEAGHNIVPFDPACQCIPDGTAASALETLADQQARELSLLVLRSALYRYAEDHEFVLPQTLEELARPFPYNYISRLPDFGGEDPAYRPERFRKHAMWASLSEVLAVDGATESYLYEEPLTVTVYKSSSRLALSSGKDRIRQYEATIGRPEQPTPNGSYQVELRVNEPVSAGKWFGTRALSFAQGAYAIHGTYDSESIGEAVSNGCVRLTNEDIEELFALTPLGTTIEVVEGATPHPDRDVPDRYVLAPGDGETTKRVFRWRG